MANGEQVQEALGRERDAAAALQVAPALQREDAARSHAAAGERDDVVDAEAGHHCGAAEPEQRERHCRAQPHLGHALAPHLAEVDVERDRGVRPVALRAT